ncbi:G-type lectin S-receptor-like serine/threonine-protein kinase RLK1 [Bidens hawaiensis]|uniref:G-type lectin S-receptor-like serine/threonine-protein kinase RLK1 n=1 Tax=Bidens hawaiensis TaxID=980011 RepID=UPI00404B51FD
MALILYFILVTILQTTSIIAQQRNGTVPVGASLTATDDAEPWLSPSGDFAFGFKQIQGKEHFVLSIWYAKIPDQIIIWYPQTSPTVSRGSKVELINRHGLVLKDPQGIEVWSSRSISDIAYGVMNDTGNFVIVGTNSSDVWESFDYPADTMLPTQVMNIGGVINSKLSETNFSKGRFQLRMLQDGNLVLNSRDIVFDFPYVAYYESRTNDTSNSSNSGSQLIFDATGYMYILRRNGQRFNLTLRNTALSSEEYYHRATLDSDGVLTLYAHLKNSTSNESWDNIWFEPKKICSHLTLITLDSRACGFNNVCNLDTERPNCECAQGFSLLDPNDPNGDCKPDFTPTCSESDSNEEIDFIELTNVNWPQSDYKYIRSIREQDCRNSCKEDCFCAVAIYNDNQCWKKKLPLVNGRKGRGEVSKALLKVRKGDIPPYIPTMFPREKKDQKTLITVISALLGISVFVSVVLIGVFFHGFFMNYKKNAINQYTNSKVVNTNLLHFTYQELVEATNVFREELGKGAFGIVYKGVIGTNIVAVKKLDRVIDDGEKEFQAEVNAIARTHHKNLVQLLGYCDEGDQRLLVYEYMSNGTLASFLFGDVRPSWKQRSNIALGIAKGLSYLHEECSTQVIHCDIKPQNILLDDYYNAKISDFGLAKLLKMNESRTNTGIRGTKGYVAPEWFRNIPVTIKVDVYSFGVLLLEIISCRKSVKEVQSGHVEYGAILTDWAWDCYQERILDAFVENDMEAIDDYKKLTTFVKTGLWCVQENPSLRPTMRKVTQVLEGVIEVSEPPCPFPFSVFSS